MNAVSLAIKTKIEQYQPIAELGVPVFIRMADKGVSPPYIIINMQSGVDEYTQQYDEMTDFVYMAKGITKHGAGALGPRIAQYINEALNHQSLAIAGHRLMGIWRTSPLEYPDPLTGQGYFHEGGIYRVKVA